MKKLKIPKKVRVGAIDYDIKFSDVVIINGSTCYAGSCCLEDGEILILKNLKEQNQFAVFTHELLHAMFYASGYREHNEEMIERLGTVLHQVLRDNNFYSTSKES